MVLDHWSNGSIINKMFYGHLAEDLYDVFFLTETLLIVLWPWERMKTIQHTFQSPKNFVNYEKKNCSNRTYEEAQKKYFLCVH